MAPGRPPMIVLKVIWVRNHVTLSRTQLLNFMRSLPLQGCYLSIFAEGVCAQNETVLKTNENAHFLISMQNRLSGQCPDNPLIIWHVLRSCYMVSALQ